MDAKRLKIILALVLLAFAGLATGLLWYYYKMPAVEPELIARVEPGMTMPDVTRLLGPPTTKTMHYEKPRRRERPAERWQYRRFFRKRMLEVTFTSKDTVRYVYHGY